MNLLETVPHTWTKASISKYCDVRLGKMLQNDPSSDRDQLKPYLRAINIARSGLDLSHEFSMWITPSEKDRFRLKNGDILVSEGGDAGRTAVFDSDREYYFQNAINRVRPAATGLILPEFIYYWFTFLKAAGYVEMVCNVATIPHFTAEKVKAAPLAVPPIETQRRIARFLDEKTARIDGLIEKKSALLDRLAEKRQALITRAVTKGLNPDAPMKPSGIDWLGDIPAHWGLVPFKWRCRVQSGQVDPREPEYADMPLIAPDHIESGTGRLYEVTSAEEQGSISGKYLCPVGSVLYSKIRPALRKVALYDAECLCSADMYAIDPGAHFDRKYLFYFLLTDAFTSYAEMESLRVAMPKVNREALGAFPLSLPSRDEQMQIAAFCSDADQQHREARDQIEASIETLEEYRAALIAAAVTGKLEIPESNVVTFPAKREANDAFKRSVLAAYIADAFCGQSTFGRVKFQKTLHLCEAHLGLEEISGNYHRRAAGPFDTQMMHSVHSQLKRQGWIEIERRSNGNGYEYRRGPKLAAYRQYYERYFGERGETIDGLLGLLAPMDTQQAEIVSTAYAAWNDLLLDGHDATDDKILHLILNDWADEKRRISEERWRAALGWMREKGLVPRGEGSHTKRG